MTESSKSFFSTQSGEHCATSCKEKCIGKAKCVFSMLLVSGVVSVITIKLMSQKIVENAITKNPKHIITSIEEMYKKEREQVQADAAKKVPEVSAELMQNTSLPYIGKKDAAKTIIMFYDYACGFCKKETVEMAKLLAETNDLKIILVDFPIMSAGSLTASQVGVYVFMNHPNEFAKYHMELMKAATVNPASIKAALQKTGLQKDATQLIAIAQKDEKIKSMLEKNYSYAKTLSLQGTPAIIINNKLVPSFIEATELTSMLNDMKDSKK